MKRSKSIRLGLIAGALTVGGSVGLNPPAAAAGYFTNDHVQPGLGYYHAPYRSWYPYPYNYYDPARQLYFHGGLWAATPHETITNISAPPTAEVDGNRAHHYPVTRHGFGNTSRRHSVYS